MNRNSASVYSKVSIDLDTNTSVRYNPLKSKPFEQATSNQQVTEPPGDSNCTPSDCQFDLKLLALRCAKN